MSTVKGKNLQNHIVFSTGKKYLVDKQLGILILRGILSDVHSALLLESHTF